MLRETCRSGRIGGRVLGSAIRGSRTGLIAAGGLQMWPLRRLAKVMS